MTREEVLAKVNAFVRDRGYQTGEAGGATGATIAALEQLGLITFTDPILGPLAAIEVRRGALDPACPYAHEAADRPVPLGEARAKQIVEGIAKAGLKIVKPAANSDVLFHLERVMTQLRTGPANNKIEAAGHLTQYGAGCILDYLQSSCGYEIVQKAET